MPAISAALEALPDNAIGKVFIEVGGPDDEIPLKKPDGVEVRWIYRGGRADLVPEERAGDHAPLITAVKDADWLPGQVQVFIHGEAQAVMHNLRPTSARNAASTPNGPTPSPGTGVAAAPKKRSGSGRPNSPGRKPPPEAPPAARQNQSPGVQRGAVQAGQQVELRADLRQLVREKYGAAARLPS